MQGKEETTRTIINQHLFCSPAQSQSFSQNFMKKSSSSCSTPHRQIVFCAAAAAHKNTKSFKESYLGLNNSFGSFSSLWANYWTIITYFSYVFLPQFFLPSLFPKCLSSYLFIFVVVFFYFGCLSALLIFELDFYIIMYFSFL